LTRALPDLFSSQVEKILAGKNCRPEEERTLFPAFAKAAYYHKTLILLCNLYGTAIATDYP
jgi:hypothetical protein